MKKKLSLFTNQYQLQKTLRFELIPQGKTLKNIERAEIIKEDEKRANDYKQVKKIIDRYHKIFIDRSLSDVKLTGLTEFKQLYIKNKDEQEKKEYEKLQDSLRKQVADIFKKNEVGTLFKKELIKNDLLDAVDLSGKALLSKDEKDLVRTFKNFTTYFTGFHENRKNIYTNEKKVTAISYRLIHENLPVFIDNLIAFEKIKNSSINLAEVSKDFKKILNGDKPGNFFTLDFYNKCLTQQGLEAYNRLLGGISKENNEKIKGLNEHINLYNQKAGKKERLPKLKQLYKQILSDSSTASFVFDEFENDNELLEAIQIFYLNVLMNFDVGGKSENIFDVLRELLTNLENYDLDKIYLKNDTTMTDISNKTYDDWSMIGNALRQYYDKNLLPNRENISNKDKKNRDIWLKQNHSIEIIQTALNQYDNEIIRKHNNKKPLITYFKNLGSDENNKSYIVAVNNNYRNIESLVKIGYPDEKRLVADKEVKAKIKLFLDSIMDLIHFIKPLDLASKDIEKNVEFYNIFDAVYMQLNETIALYNKVRNYLTRKPYSTEKIKLNFENSHLLAGWDISKEKANTCTLLKKEEDGREFFYLGIFNKQYNRIFDIIPGNNGSSSYQKMVYKLLPGAAKTIPKCSTQMNEVQRHFKESNSSYILSSDNFIEPLTISYDVFKLNNYVYDSGSNEFILKSDEGNNSYKKFQTGYLKDTGDEKGFRSALGEWIDFCKDFLGKYKSTANYSYKFKESSSYNSLDEFYKEVDANSHKINFIDVPESYIHELVKDAKLYLFKIYNKDFSRYSKGKSNLHTIYWKMIFDKNNLKDVVYKLNGEAEVFYRRKSIENPTVHKANVPIASRRAEENGDKVNNLFEYDIVKDRRFTMDKFQFHVPITLNFKAEGNEKLDTHVNQFLKDNPEVNIIGLDRGERHLIYLTLINQKGEILIQESLNRVMGTNYQEKLGKVESDRNRERKDWEEIENIKELKSGYLSQVVHKIARMIIEHNAIVVMEDLNFGFKQGRIKVEKQVYQKFEKALIDKLNYLVFKDKNPEDAGGALKALQLTSKFESFKKLGKQCGFIFYVGADYTSKIDPATGFVNLLYPKYENLEKSKEFFSKFDAIRYNPGKDYFEFSFDYSNFTDRAEGTRLNWTVCTVGEERYFYDRITKKTDAINVTEELKALLKSNNISFQDGTNLIEMIVQNGTKDFYRDFIKFLQRTLQMRQSNAEKGIDCILSPVADKNGEFFDSRNAGESVPKDADANGAYHIALKGLMVLDKINKTRDVTKFKFKDMAISNKEWIQFAQGRREQ